MKKGRIIIRDFIAPMVLESDILGRGVWPFVTIVKTAARGESDATDVCPQPLGRPLRRPEMGTQTRR